MNNYSAHNKAVFIKLVTSFVKKTKARIDAMLGDCALEMLNDIEQYTILYPDNKGGYLPAYTGNLFQSTGIGVYNDSVLESFEPRRFSGIDEYDSIPDGGTQLIQALNSGVTVFRQGQWLVVFSAANYAFDINEVGSKSGRGEGYFERIKEKTEKVVRTNLKQAFPDLIQ